VPERAGGWPGPRRDSYTFRLTEEEAQPLHERAEQIPKRPNGLPNLSEALRQILAEWAAGRRTSPAAHSDQEGPHR